MTFGPRYAVYLAPPAESALWRFGSAVLGYDAGSGAEPVSPDLAGFDAETWRAMTAEPRRYGFHGTLKAPFRLAAGRSLADLEAAAAAVAAEHHPFELPPLVVHAIGAFVALVPSLAVPALLEIARCSVLDLDVLRAPLTPAERARRRPDRLSARQSAHLSRYGYPYVLDEFRFHMTLTGPLPDAERGHALNALSEAFAAAGADVPVTIEDIALCIQEEAGGRFRIARRIPLGRSPSPANGDKHPG